MSCITKIKAVKGLKLVLSSCDFRNEKSKNVISENLPKAIEQCHVLFIPNEKATYDAIHSDKYYSRLADFGFKKENITVFDYYNPTGFDNLRLDVIFVSGGNTFMTLDRIRKSGFDSTLIKYIENGVTYIGGSAGAHIVSADISHLKGIDDLPEGFCDFSGLGLFKGILICHYSDERRALYEALKSQDLYTVTTLADDETIVLT